MRAVIQRVTRASVAVNGGEPRPIGPGLVILLGVRDTDDIAIVPKLAEKCAHLRIFEDEQEKMNLSVADVGGGLLVVSQFTLYGDCRKGKRPSFDRRRVLKWPMLIMKNLWPEHGRRGLASAPGSFRRICL